MAKNKSSIETEARRGAPVARTRKGAQATPSAAAEPSPLPASNPGPARATKHALIIGLLQREGGATLDDLVAATGWLPHTTRAALTRLRQAGHVLDKSKGETGAAVYRIAAPARATRSREAA